MIANSALPNTGHHYIGLASHRAPYIVHTNREFSVKQSVTLLMVMIEKWLTAVSFMQTTQVHLQCYLHYPLLLALSVPVAHRESNYIAAFVSPAVASRSQVVSWSST